MEKKILEMKNYIINTFAIIISLIVTIFLVEFSLHAINKLKNITFVVGWRYPGKDKHVNQLGFKGRRIDYSNNSIVILLLGDSQVEAENLPFGCFPEQALEYHLSFLNPQVKAFSLGATGYGNDQQLLVLKEYFQKYRADYVLLWQTITNDIWNNIFPTHCPKDGWPKPTFWLENGVLKGPII